MKPQAFSFVVLADQIGSRTGPDRVPAALRALDDLPLTLPFERTAGDELQGLSAEPRAVVDSVVRLTRLAGWRIGVGVGPVESPLPESTRAARGEAYLAARSAIGTAKQAPTGLSVRLCELGSGDPDHDVSADRYGELTEATRDVEAALWMLRSILMRRSGEGWELMDLLDEGLTNAAAAARLGISPSAVSQRLSRAARLEAGRGAELCVHLLTRLQSASVALT